jgi:hypothetical protein
VTPAPTGVAPTAAPTAAPTNAQPTAAPTERAPAATHRPDRTQRLTDAWTPQHQYEWRLGTVRCRHRACPSGRAAVRYRAGDGRLVPTPDALRRDRLFLVHRIPAAIGAMLHTQSGSRRT